MYIILVKTFLCRSDVRIVILGTISGGILQVLAKRYLKAHPELLENPPKLLPRGGELVSSVALFKAILAFLAEHGLTAGALSGFCIIVSRIPTTAISTVLRQSLPQNLAHLEKKNCIVVDGKNVDLNECEGSLIYLLEMLTDERIPFEERRKAIYSVVTKYLDLKTRSGRINFMICMVSICSILRFTNSSSFCLMIEGLIKAIREGRISKAMGRFILRRLERLGIIVNNPEMRQLAELIAEFETLTYTATKTNKYALDEVIKIEKRKF